MATIYIPCIFPPSSEDSNRRSGGNQPCRTGWICCSSFLRQSSSPRPSIASPPCPGGKPTSRSPFHSLRSLGGTNLDVKRNRGNLKKMGAQREIVAVTHQLQLSTCITDSFRYHSQYTWIVGVPARGFKPRFYIWSSSDLHFQAPQPNIFGAGTACIPLLLGVVVI